jgi:hypothetical protein
MVGRNDHLLNRLNHELPEGLLAHSAWFRKKGYSRQLLNHYVSAGWLEQPARGLFRRPRGTLSWQQVVISLQTLLLDDPFIVGGRTALELQGYAHFLPHTTTEVHLYGPRPLPAWLDRLPLEVRFVHHNSRRLFKNDPITYGISSLTMNVLTHASASNDPLRQGLTFQPWGPWDWHLTLSTPERAILELLDALPARESFAQADALMEGLATLSPRRLQTLLVECRSVKVKRLFFFFADRHRHAWLKALDKKAIDLGTGNRMLVKGGRLDRTYQITVPEDLGAV